MTFLFEKLEVYQKGVNFAESVSNIADSFPRGHSYLADQLNRAALSISTNIAEGNGRFHPKDRLNFFWISRGSAQECVPILELCQRKGLITLDQWKKLTEDLQEITKMLSGLIHRGMAKISENIL